MGHITLTLLCLCSCGLMVTPIELADLERATQYFEQNIFMPYTGQYAYFVKFTADECNRGLRENDLQTVLTEINVNDVIAALRNREVIYEGQRMVAAIPRNLTRNNRQYTEHSEWRLLNPQNNSPVCRLLAANLRAGCVVFFSLNSPCVTKCTSPNGQYNIITMLNNLNQLPNNMNSRAFVFRNVFWHDRTNPDQNVVWNSWTALNNVMNLFRCNNNNCYRCFNNNVRDNRCYNN